MKNKTFSNGYWGVMSMGIAFMSKSFYGLFGGQSDPKITGLLYAIGIVAIVSDFWQRQTSIEKTLYICGIKKEYNGKAYVPKIIKTDKNEDRTIYHLTLPVGLCLSDFEEKHEQIEQALNKQAQFEYANKRILMTVIEKRLLSSYPFEKIQLVGDLPIVVGHTLDGIKIIDLADTASPHLGIYGETNSGKSVELRGILTQLILNKPDDKLQLHLIDLKRVELSIFKQCSIVKSFSNDIEKAEEILKEICKLTDERFKLLEHAGTVNIKGYNKKAKKRLPYILVVVDEFTDLMESDKAIKYVHELARKARAVGIHLILTTQRPDRDCLDSKIKSNVGNVIGLKTISEINSRVIMDQGGLEKLRGKGHGLLKMSGQITEFQSEFLDEDTARDLIEHTFRKDEPLKALPVKTAKIEVQPRKKKGRVKC